MHENTNASLEKNKLIVARSNRYTFLPFKSEAKYGVHYFILHWAGQKEINDEFFIRHKQPWLHPSRLGIFILFCFVVFLFVHQYYSHLLCTLISENQGLDKSRSVSNLIKISVPVHLNFFFQCT